MILGGRAGVVQMYIFNTFKQKQGGRGDGSVKGPSQFGHGKAKGGNMLSI